METSQQSFATWIRIHFFLLVELMDVSKLEPIGRHFFQPADFFAAKGAASVIK
ncbi:MAG: hypothetical protein ACJA04_000017 [Cellvibrionaceae bacterium]|jgi:hypothetical protein